MPKRSLFRQIAAILTFVCLGAGPAAAESPAAGPSAASKPATYFENVTEQVGLTGLTTYQGTWVDYNNDGFVDIYAIDQLWRNEGGKRFVRVKDAAVRGAGIWGDFDNDGFADLFCWQGPVRLFRNVEGRKFLDVSDRMPALPMKQSRGAVWADLNGDGFLDLYVGGYERPSYQPDAIYMSDGKGGFTLAWKTTGKPQPARGVTAADYDEDGDVDVYVSNYRLAPNFLLQNDGQGKLTDVAAKAGVAGDGGLGAWGHTIGSTWGDLDNDGHIDLFAGNFSHRPAYQDRPKFYRSLGPAGAFRFEDRSGAAGLAWQESFASPTLGDFDNDGLLDLFFSTVYPRDHCVLYRNTGNWRFKNVTGESGISAKQTYQAAWGDFDNDGRLDMITGGRLWRNRLGEGNWLKLRLRGDGKAVNTGAIGAQARIHLPQGTLTRQVEGACGEGNQNQPLLHFGLGGHSGELTVKIRWPDGRQQTIKSRPNRTVDVTYSPE